MLEKAPYNLKSPGHHLRPTHRRVKSYPIRTPKLKRQDGKENLTSPVALYRWPRARGMLGARLGGWKTFSGNHRPNGRGTPRPSTRTKHARGRLHPWPEGCAGITFLCLHRIRRKATMVNVNWHVPNSPRFQKQVGKAF